MLAPDRMSRTVLANFGRVKTTAKTHRCVRSAAGKKPDYNSRRAGGQEENSRRRENAHQMPLSARMSTPGGRDSRDDGNGKLRARSNKGGKWSSTARRRRGRPAHQRSPDDSPLRDGNRDRLIGLLTKRAAKTLEYYFIETNLTYHSWLSAYIKANPIPVEKGSWDAVSGEEFLRKLLTEGVNETSYSGGVKDPLFTCVGTIGIDPRAIGQRIMDIRSALADEFIQDLQGVAEENAILMRECAMASLSALEVLESADEGDGALVTPHPEMLSDDGPVAIPDTAAAFLESVGGSNLDKFQNKPSTDADPDAPPPESDTPRPGLDDINEFESELEAGDKWKRRFRRQREQDAAAADAFSEPSDAADAQAAAASKDEDEEVLLDAEEAVDAVGSVPLAQEEGDQASAQVEETVDEEGDEAPKEAKQPSPDSAEAQLGAQALEGAGAGEDDARGDSTKQASDLKASPVGNQAGTAVDEEAIQGRAQDQVSATGSSAELPLDGTGHADSAEPVEGIATQSESPSDAPASQGLEEQGDSSAEVLEAGEGPKSSRAEGGGRGAKSDKPADGQDAK